MFDISFSEMAIVGVVALIVIGPERLPKVARTAGHLFGRLQRYVANVKADINREIDASELSKVKQEVTEAARAFEQTVQQQANAFENEARAIEKAAVDSATASPTPTTAPALTDTTSIQSTTPTQAAMLAEQDGDWAAAPESPVKTKPSVGASSLTPQQSDFDFGIEPVRPAVSARTVAAKA